MIIRIVFTIDKSPVLGLFLLIDIVFHTQRTFGNYSFFHDIYTLLDEQVYEKKLGVILHNNHCVSFLYYSL